MKESELAVLSGRLPLDDGELPPGVSTKDAEHAIGLLLAEARRLVLESKDKGLDWGSVVANSLALNGDTDLLAKLFPDDAPNPLPQWRDSLADWEGDCGVFLELHADLMLLHGADRRIRQYEGGKKGIEQNNLQRSTDAEEKKRICRGFFLRYCESQKVRKRPSRQEAFNKLKREWRDLSRERPELKSPSFSSFKEYCKGL